VWVAQDRGSASVDGAVLRPNAFVLRFFTPDADDRLLLVNLGCDLELTPAPEPLLAPPAGRSWQLAFSSEELAYGGSGTPAYDPREQGFALLGEAALLFRAAPGGEP
jgi:maltooligosyltrehalose trehalohydrolase